jgi:hypothetical protein
MLTTTLSSPCLPRRTEFPQSDFATVTNDAVTHDAGIENAERIPDLSELLFSLRIIPLQIASELTMELRPDFAAQAPTIVTCVRNWTRKMFAKKSQFKPNIAIKTV